ncbi:MAG: two-component system sensor histidine kinase PilS (NtrC family) [Candidatus Azotimanducaceae bacterium]|jgi:two-component system sensor histidine kinase PilS (NtrC family)
MADAAPDGSQSLQRTTLLRVYNYYRILISFLFLFLFLDSNFNAFIGKFNPGLFQITIMVYLCMNIVVGLATFFIRVEWLVKTTPAFAILLADIICLTLLISASGGVSSGLGNFLIFTCAFSGSLILGRVSSVIPAIAFILVVYDEFYLFFLGENSLQSFFQAGVLGVVYFVANVFFQTASQQLRKTESQVYTLEQINQLIIDTLKTGVVVVTSTGKIKSINHAGESFLRIPAEPGIARDKLPYRLVDKLNDWKASPQKGSAVFHTRETSPELIASFSTLGSAGDDTDTLIFIEDSTEVQRQAQQLKLAALGRLSASIAHEIRNPLGAISHAAQLLRESPDLSKGDLRLSEIIQNHCLRMNGVIENVLHMSRRTNAAPQLLPLVEWLAHFVSEFVAGQPGQPIIDVDIVPADMKIYMDPQHLAQILGNLCQNGLRYSEQATCEARIVLRGRLDTGSQSPYLEIIDFGHGVDKSLVDHLFEPFYTTEATGTGLGLYLSMELSQANNVRLSYSRTSQGGSCFRIAFLEVFRPISQQ